MHPDTTDAASTTSPDRYIARHAKRVTVALCCKPSAPDRGPLPRLTLRGAA